MAAAPLARAVVKATRDGLTAEDRALAEECPVAMVFDGGTQAVMMATPRDLEDFARGFAKTEGFIASDADIRAIDDDGSTRQIDSGLIKIYIWDLSTFKYGLLDTVTAPTDGSTLNENANFGWAHKISEPGITSTRTTADKYMFVSAPGHSNDKGRV